MPARLFDTSNQFMTSRHRLTIVVIGGLFLCLGTIYSCNQKGDLRVVSRNFESEVEQQQNLIFTFNKDVYPDSMLGNWDSTVYIDFSPAVKGLFKWNSSNEVVFSPAHGFAPGAEYTARLSKTLLSHSKKKYKVSGEPIVFHTAPLMVTATHLSWTRGKNVANVMVQNNFEMVPVLSTLFKSEHFFDPDNIGCHIKNPVDHMVGVCRQFNIVFPDNTNLPNQYLGWGIIMSCLQNLSMDPGDPPNVAGWPAYYQEPQFHELWINSDTLPLRNKYTDALCSSSGITKNSVNLKIDVLAFATNTSNPSDPNQLIADCASLLSPNDLGATQTAFLKTILLSGQTNDAYWTSAWNQYIGTPSNTTYQNTVATRLRSMLSYIMDLAEYQLI